MNGAEVQIEDRSEYSKSVAQGNAEPSSGGSSAAIPDRAGWSRPSPRGQVDCGLDRPHPQSSSVSFTTIQVEQDGKVRRIRLNRPDVHNAFNGSVVEELTRAFREAGDDRETRVVVLSGNGPSFSAGADLAWMREQARLPAGQGETSARVMGEMFLAVARCPKAALPALASTSSSRSRSLTPPC